MSDIFALLSSTAGAIPVLHGPALKSWREGNRITQVQLAGLLDVTRETVQNWEHGRTAVPRAVTFAVAHLNALLDAAETPTRKPRRASRKAVAA